MEAASVHILLVEDNVDHAFITRRAIQTAHNEGLANFKLDEVEDGEAAIDYLFQRGRYTQAPRPDLVLLDLQLPIKSGFEVLEAVKQEPSLHRIPIVVLTTSDAQKDILHSYDLYANGYVSKPVSATEYMEKVRSIATYWSKISRLPRE